MKILPEDRHKFETKPNEFLAKIIKEYAVTCPANRLPEYNNEPAMTEPLVGFADGHDPLFQEYKKKEIIGDFHFTPEEALIYYHEIQQKNVKNKKPANISVISVAFLASRETRLSTPPEAEKASSRFCYTYIHVADMMFDTLNQVVSLLEAEGYQAVAPDCTRPVPMETNAEGFHYTDWSEKHVAYTAGLGTFGLQTLLVTPAGIPLHIASVITDLALTPTPRKYDHHRYHCLHYRDGSCHRCAQRCPVRAIKPYTFDQNKCLDYFFELEAAKDKSQETIPAMCALCLVGVPCEAGVPCP